MRVNAAFPGARALRLAAFAAAAAALGWALRAVLGQVAELALGAALIAFVAEPLAKVFERRLTRGAASLAALLTLGGGIALVLWLLLPGMLREVMELMRIVPEALSRLSGWLNGLSAWAEARLPGLTLPELAPGAGSALPELASGTIAVAANLADVIGKLSLSAVLACFFLCDRERLLLRLELLLPQACRPTAVRMGKAVLRELRLYLRAQLMVALAVGALSGAALMLLRVRSAAALGPLIGLLNMIPYFGPFIGGLPAVLIALGDGWRKALMTAGALALVQQLDGALISPRIMGGVTGLSPAAVLVAIFAGARLAGVPGMFFALPVLMVGRTVYRVFVQRNENI